MTDEKKYTSEHSTARLEAFSDGVIAIIVTLLVFQINIPELAKLDNSSVLQSLVPIIPKLVAFSVSFITVCIYWVNHHHFMHPVVRVDRNLLWYNNHLLFWLAIIPFVTGFIGQYPTQPVVVALYGFVLMMGAIAFKLMMRHVFFKTSLVHSDIPEEFKRKEYRRAQIAVVLYGIAAVAAFIHPYISLGIYILTPFYYFMPRTAVGWLAMNPEND